MAAHMRISISVCLVLCFFSTRSLTHAARTAHRPGFGGSAFLLHVPDRMSQLTRLRSAPDQQSAAPLASPDATVMSWEEKIDHLLRPATTMSQRSVLAQDLLKQAPEIRSEIVSLLLGAVPRRRDLGALRRQVLRDLLPTLASDMPQLTTKVVARLPTASQSVARSLPPLMRRSLRAVRRGLPLAPLLREGKNALRRTPQGIETPRYSLERKVDEYEVRRYSGYSIASVKMGRVSPGKITTDLLATGTALGKLLAYYLGNNVPLGASTTAASNGTSYSGAMGMMNDTQIPAKRPPKPPTATTDTDGGVVMDLTTPIMIERTRKGALYMTFVLPSEYQQVGRAPEPYDIAVSVQERLPETVAVLRFAGFATENEIQRRLEELKVEIARDGVFAVADDDAFRLHMYNGPQKLPWLRSNEVCVNVKRLKPAS
ncbi:unnamed protein product [Vitrella brassicaformis CCMP3155]|uniref:SOUL heme-binding protein n=2 Tax=Vitrella brassicaformis TaxID=1169539 RepID=A0A0G4EJ56_VITBC|nr:unnamed protein product [Vitrella brassicaformis CCMP3155]|eukprot:CEL96738.1 unnamed protein product [Vitrella brassicaformis CCMP3155]